MSHRSGPIFVEPARPLPAVPLLEHTALLRQHLGQRTTTHTYKDFKSVHAAEIYTTVNKSGIST